MKQCSNGQFFSQMQNWEVYQKAQIIQIYNVCFNHKTHQTHFVSYDVTSYKLEPQKISIKYTEWDENLANFFGLESVPQRYQKASQIITYLWFSINFKDNKPYLIIVILKEYQSHIFHYVKNKWNNQDYLKEQMLIPSIDLREDQAGRSIMTYLTVAPQWKSLHHYWKELNKLIKENIINVCSPTFSSDISTLVKSYIHRTFSHLT